jgi:hypothetical protein
MRYRQLNIHVVELALPASLKSPVLFKELCYYVAVHRYFEIVTIRGSVMNRSPSEQIRQSNMVSPIVMHKRGINSTVGAYNVRGKNCFQVTVGALLSI